MSLISVTVNPENDHYKRLKSFPSCKEGAVIPFDPYLTWIVGENGMGKSTFIHGFMEMIKPLPDHINLFSSCKMPDVREVNFFDFEYDNPHSQKGKGFNQKVSYTTQIALMWSSHGESTYQILLDRFVQVEKDKIPRLIICDEPETSLSPWTQMRVIELLKDAQKMQLPIQLIWVTHSVLFIQSKIGSILDFNSSPPELIKAEDYTLNLKLRTDNKFNNPLDNSFKRPELKINVFNKK